MGTDIVDGIFREISLHSSFPFPCRFSLLNILSLDDDISIVDYGETYASMLHAYDGDSMTTRLY